MKTLVNFVLSRYGSAVKITEKGNTIKTKVFIEPMHNKDSTYFNIKSLPTGKLDNRHFLLIGRPDLSLNKSGGTIVEYGQDKYITKTVGSYDAAGKKVYVWAVLTACTDPLEDDYDSSK